MYSAGAGIGAAKARPIEQSMDYASIVKETVRVLNFLVPNSYSSILGKATL